MSSPCSLSGGQVLWRPGCDRWPTPSTQSWTALASSVFNLIAVEFPGRKHATLTEHRQQEAVDRVLCFLEGKLKPSIGQTS